MLRLLKFCPGSWNLTLLKCSSRIVQDHNYYRQFTHSSLWFLKMLLLNSPHPICCDFSTSIQRIFRCQVLKAIHNVSHGAEKLMATRCDKLSTTTHRFDISAGNRNWSATERGREAVSWPAACYANHQILPSHEWSAGEKTQAFKCFFVHFPVNLPSSEPGEGVFINSAQFSFLSLHHFHVSNQNTYNFANGLRRLNDTTFVDRSNHIDLISIIPFQFGGNFNDFPSRASQASSKHPLITWFKNLEILP